MTYPGGKNGAGVYQRIINLIPPHRVYIEPFAGSAAVLRRKRPAASTIAVEIDPRAAAELRSSLTTMGPRACTVVEGDGIQFLRDYAWRGDEFVYCDPPYIMSTRRSGRIYEHEFSDADHRELVSLLLTIPAGVMLSGYRSALYDDALSSWCRVDYQAMTRGGSLADESLWLNYAPPALLHDYTYIGETFRERERERIKRKRQRWVSNLLAMPPAERHAVYGSLVEAMRDRSSLDPKLRPGASSPAPVPSTASPGRAVRSASSPRTMLQDLA